MNSAAVTAWDAALASHYNNLRSDVLNRWIVGEIKVWTTTSAPNADWMICDWTAISRTTYSVLFALIGTTYGVWNGTTTFNIPNLKGKVVVGVNSSDTEFDTIWETWWAKTHTLAESEIPSHSHNYDVHNGWGGGLRPIQNTTGSSSATTGSTNTAGWGWAHNNLQPYMALEYIICVTNV